MDFPIRIPLRIWIDTAVFYVTAQYADFFDAVSELVQRQLNAFERILLWPPWWAIVIVVTLIAWRLAGRWMGVFTAAGLLLILSLGLWRETMGTLALVLAATMLSILLGVPLGILAARSKVVYQVLQPLLDLMQTMPSFVYLIPTLLLFGMGRVPAVFATVVFGMPPAVRLTRLGIMQVPEEVIEAGRSFGATPLQMLLDIQLPIALPTIMAGINQTILLALSMVVIAGMIGAGGLGRTVLNGITQVKPGIGFEGGISIVILAIILDRITQTIGHTKKDFN
ncbi:MAG: ABC transporter permease [bacterium]|jgi:glycine betaine/proline transport system permease protein